MDDKAKRRVLPGDTVVVTGAAGGVGRHLVRALLDAGCDVVAIDRTPFADAPAIESLFDEGETTWITGDLADMPLEEALSGARAVVNAAARVGLSESYDQLVDSNVVAVGRLWDAANACGVEHFIQISAGSLYEPSRGLRKESDPIVPDNDYEQSKADAEAVLPPDMSAEPTRWTILRPAHIYGPHCMSMASGLVTLPPILGNFLRYQPGFTGGARTSWCHVEDVASAAMAVLGKPAAYGRVFNVADDTPLGFGELLTAVTEAYGLEIGPLIPFPGPTVLLAFSPVVDRDYVTNVIRTVLRQLWKRLAERHGLDTPLRPRVDRNALFYVAEDTVLDNAALEDLGWSPKWTSFAEGIVETLEWYQEHDWVPRYDAASLERTGETGRTFGFKQEIRGRWIESETSRSRDALVSLEVEFHRVQTTLPGDINGMIWLEGLADGAAVEGTIELAIVGRELSYEFGFKGDEGRAYRGSLDAQFNPLKPLSSMSDLTGRLTAGDGRTIGRFELSLDLADQLVPMLLSFRLQ